MLTPAVSIKATAFEVNVYICIVILIVQTRISSLEWKSDGSL